MILPVDPTKIRQAAAIHERAARKRRQRAAAGIGLLAAMILLLTGCGTGRVLDGSRVCDAAGFRMEYRTLNREESAELYLTAGEGLRVSLSHTEGTVDVTVGLEGREPIYRGGGQQNAGFVLEIPETGNYRISVSGHGAKGRVSFARIPGGQE